MYFTSLSRMCPPMPAVLEDTFSKVIFNCIYFIIYIPEYCRLLLYKHYQKVAIFGVILGSILIQSYLLILSPLMPSFLLGKFIFLVYLGFVCKIVGKAMRDFSEWMKSYKANKLLRSAPADLPMSKKNVYSVLEELAKSVAESAMTRQGFWWDTGVKVESDKGVALITKELSLDDSLAAKLSAAESRGEVVDVEEEGSGGFGMFSSSDDEEDDDDDEMKMAMRIRKEMHRRFKAQRAADSSESLVKQEKSD